MTRTLTKPWHELKPAAGKSACSYMDICKGHGKLLGMAWKNVTGEKPTRDTDSKNERTTGLHR